MNTLCPFCSSYSADHTGSFSTTQKEPIQKGKKIEMQLEGGKKRKKKTQKNQTGHTYSKKSGIV